MKNQVCITTVTLSILQASLGQFRVFKAGSVLPFCILNEAWGSLLRPYTATSHLSVRVTAMHVTVNEVSSHLCKILTLIIVKTYLQTGPRRYRIARRPIVTYYNSAKPNTVKSFRKRPKLTAFVFRWTQNRNGLYN